MKDLFHRDSIRLSVWYIAFPDFETGGTKRENQRSVEMGTRISHLRPIWMPAERFSVGRFASMVKEVYRERFVRHDSIEVPIRMTDNERETLSTYFSEEG